MSPTQTINLMAIDDDDLDIENIRRALKRGGIMDPLFTARDGQEALRMLRSGEVPRERLVLLLDLNMPGMSGLEFLDELRADQGLSSLPVVVLTTSNEETDRVKAYDRNVAGYLLKPLQFERFVELMRAMHAYWGMVQFAPPG